MFFLVNHEPLWSCSGNWVDPLASRINGKFPTPHRELKRKKAEAFSTNRDHTMIPFSLGINDDNKKEEDEVELYSVLIEALIQDAL